MAKSKFKATKSKKLKCFNTNIIRATKQTIKMAKSKFKATQLRDKGSIYMDDSRPRKLVKKIGNNQKCPCKSEKKYKKCCKKNVILNKKTKKVQLGRRVQWDEN